MDILFRKKNISFIFLFFVLFCVSTIYAQQPFTARLENPTDPTLRYVNIRGDYTFLSNSVMNRRSFSRSANEPYNGTSSNNSLHIEYVDLDGDPSTFSSSSSTLNLDECSRIFYAGLYWAGNYDRDVVNSRFRRSLPNDNNRYDFTTIKLRVPGGTYVDITADNNPDPVGEEDEIIIDGFNTVQDNPYVCYKNVTNQLQALADPSGEYFVGNVRGTRGRTSYGVAGWTLVVIYENPNLPGRYISVFDGYEGVNTRTVANSTADVIVNGFNTIPVGPVTAKLGVGVLEGESTLSGDSFSIRADANANFTPLSNAANPANNFFNSNITIDGANDLNRNLNSTNSLGYDSDIFDIDNPANSIIDNNESGATLRLRSEGDFYAAFLVAFGVDIIEPNIILEKRVEDIAGNDITGAGVNLGQVLDYVLSFQNIGNDDGTNYTIRDVLPINVTLDETNLTLPPGVTYTFDPATRTVVFTIPDGLIEQNDPISSIRLRVQVAQNCFDFIDACTDQIENVAFSTYAGVINDNIITDDPSVRDVDVCGFASPGATNFLLDDLDDCDFSRTVQLCGDSVTLDAGNGFDDYVWYIDENADGLIDAGDTVIAGENTDMLVVTEIGTYIVDKIIADPCKGFQEIITVTQFGLTQSNPIIDLINDTSNTVEGEIVVCPNDGEQLPEIFLCGLNDTELIQINIPDAESIEWQLLDEASCSAATEDCANRNNTCTWNTVETGGDFIASDAGQYRVVINYANGCFTRFYFNIFKNNLDPQFNSRDIICTTPGNITVTNVPLDYEFQLVDAANDAILVPYSSNNGPSFTIATNGAYRVEMRQQGVVDGCIFVLDNIGILNRDFQVDVTPRDTDCNGLGEISISILNVEAQYYYEISQGGTVVDTFGPSNDNNYTFENLNDGTYDILATTDDGCSYTEQVIINDLSDLDLSARVSQHITCREGNIQMESTGGRTPHTYAIWSYVDEAGTTVVSYPDVTDIPAGEFQTSVIFDILDPGDYTFVVVDRNNCHAFSNTVTIEFVPAADFNPTSVVDVTCFGEATGSITFNVLNTNGYQLTYFLFDATTFDENNYDVTNAIATNDIGEFTGLSSGDYAIVVNQARGNASCDFIEYHTISTPTNAIAGTATLIQDYTCTQEGIIEVQSVTGGTAPYSFSIDGVTFIPDTTPNANRFENLTDGSYTITIRDANGCLFDTTLITIEPLNPPTDLTFTASNPTCPSLTSDIVVTVIDGNTPFIFEIIAPSSIAATSTNTTTANFDDLAPDTYTFRVTDNKNCVYEESFTIAPVTPITVIGALVSNITCFDDTDGEARFTVANFNTSYNYTVSGPSNFSGTNETNGTIDLTGLDDGTYTITVTDNDTNCTATTDIMINAPPGPLTLGLDVTQPTCTAPGSIIATASDGWGGYSYELTNPDGSSGGTNTTGSFGGLTFDANPYTIAVTDANGCVVDTTFTLNEAIAPVLEIVPNNTCYDSAVGLTLTANVTAGGDGAFEYSLNNGAFSTNNVFTGLGPGAYRIDVRDGNNCTDFETITINPELSLIANAPNITSCGTNTDVTITAAGGDGNYTYAIVADGTTPNAGNFATTNPVTVNSAGDYDVYVRDNAGNAGFCEAVFDITIVQDPTLALTITNTPILCSGEATATLTIAPSGGEAPYRYSIDNGATFQTTATFPNLAAGSYNVVLRDANGCDISQTYAITEPITLSASAGVTQLAQCNPSLGAEVRITNIIGGTSPYQYSFDGGATYGTNAIAFLQPGTHSLFVRDANGCPFPLTVTVDPEPTPPNATASIAYDCDGDGVITVTPDSPDFDYTYELDGALNSPADSNVFADIAPGNYTVTVNYISNIAPTPSVLLSESFGVGPNTSITEIDPVYCYEPQDGSPSSCPAFGTDTRIQDGEYSVTQVVTNPFGSWLSPTDHTDIVNGTTNGRFLAINVGGVAGVNGIIYAKRGVEVIPNRDVTISLWAFNLLRNGESGGDPSIEIQLVDAGGTIIASTATTDIPKNTGVTDWHNYAVNLNPGANTNLDIVIRTNSAVTDGNDIAIDDIEAIQTPEVCGGSLDVPVIIEAGNAFEANATTFSNISCNGGSDGSITFEIENFDTNFSYQIDGGGFSAPQSTSPITITGLSAGLHTIEVRTTDTLGNTCSDSFSETLTEPVPIVAAVSLTAPATCLDGATLTASATGGTPNYEYQLELNDGGLTAGSYNITSVITPFQNGAIFNNVPQNAIGESYVVRVRDANGCIDVIDNAIVIDGPNLIAFDATPTACYTGNSSGTISIVVTDGNGGYQFQLDGGPWLTPTPTTDINFTFANLSAGTYTVNVRDSFGCDGTAVPVIINPQLNATATLQNNLTCLADATIEVNAAGGSGTYTYEWATTATGPFNTTQFTGNLFTTSTDGDFFFRVTDTTVPTACSDIVGPITINPAVSPVITSVTPTNLQCNGDNSGSLAINIDTTIGLAPYTINVLNTTTGTDYGTQFSGLAAGDYTITVTDSNGCDTTANATITEPSVINYTVTSVPITCDSGAMVTNPGSIAVSGVSGGTPEYTYILTANNGITPQTHITTPGTRDHTFTILSFGIYQLDVEDANGCTAFSTEIIASPPNDLNIDVTTLTADCTTGGTAIVEVGAAVGSGNYEFAILENFTPPYVDDPVNDYIDPDTPGGSIATFTGLIPGITYTFVVFDTTTMCYYFETADTPITSPSNMTVSSLVEANVSCTGADDGNVTFTFDNYDSAATAVTYEIFNSQSNVSTGFTGTSNVNPPTGAITVSNFATLAPGEYFLLLSEVGGPFNGCSIAGGEFTIRESVRRLELDVAVTRNDNCNPNAGILTATGRFGTGPYEFFFTPAPPNPADPPVVYTVATWPGSSDNVFDGEGNIYDVYVRDAFGCIVTERIALPTDPSPEISIAIVDECVDQGAFQVIITLDNPTIALSPFQLSVNGNPFQNITFDASNEFMVSNLNSGLGQTIAVRDVNGCSDVEILDIQVPLDFTVIQTVALDCEAGAAANAEIEIEVTSGSGNYEFLIDGPGTIDQTRTPLPSNPFTWTGASAAGAYNVTVFDLGTTPPNCFDTVVIDIQDAPVPDFSVIETAVTCNGGLDGNIRLAEVDNGINPLSFILTPMPAGAVLNGNTFENLPAGTYSVRGIGTNSCFTDIFDIVITEPAAIVVSSPTVMEFNCMSGNNADNASITVSGIIGGSGTYTRYRFFRTDDPATVIVEPDIEVQNNTNASYTELNFNGGFYGIEVFDSEGCIGNTTARILPFDQLQSAATAITNPISCINSGEAISIDAISSITNFTTDPANYEFRQLPSGAFSSSNTFANLGVGTHNFEVLNVATNCIIPVSHTVVEPNVFTIDVVKLSDVQCFGTETGEITLELQDVTYTGGFSWTIFNTNGTADRTDDTVYTGADATGSIATTGPTGILNLTAGSYIVEIVQDAFPDCTNIEAFTIAGPPAIITGNTTVTNISCVPGNDGVIQVIDVAGGFGDYQYYVDTTPITDQFDVTNYVGNPRFANLTAGTYQIWVIDSSGCPQQLPDVVLTNPTPIIADLQINNFNCMNLEGEIEVVGVPATNAISGGQGSNYSFQLIRNGSNVGSPQNTPVFSNLGAGSYEVLVFDQLGCDTTVGPVVLTDAITATATVVKPIDCTPDPGGQITINVNGGSTNLEYVVLFPDLTTLVTQNNGVFTNLTQDGEYIFTITDLDTGMPTCTFEVRQSLEDSVDPVLLDATIQNISCFGGSDGSITAALDPATATNPVYMYELYRTSDLVTPIRPAQASPLFENLDADSYQVRVISSRSCEDVKVEVITQPNTLVATANATDFNCALNNTVNVSTITVTATDGTAPYLYSIDNVNFQTSNTFEVADNSTTQNVTIYVRDANSCTTTDSVTITPLNTFTAAIAQNTAISCVNPEAITITVTETGIPGDVYTFELLPIGNPTGTLLSTTTTTADFSLNAPGSYTFRITNNVTGCYVDAIHNIAPFDLIEVNATATNPVTCFNDNSGELTITISGYVGGYSYVVFDQAGNSVQTGNGTTPTLLIGGLNGGNYYVAVTETDPTSTQCSDDSNFVTIVSPDAELLAVPSIVAPVTCTNDQGAIAINIDGGYAPYDVSMTNTTTGQTYLVNDILVQTFTGLSAGTFDITVTDDEGCIRTYNETLVPAVPVSANISAAPLLLECFGDTNATVSAISVLNGSGSYQYQLNEFASLGDTTPLFTGGLQSSPDFNNLGAGIYSITVVDGWDCDFTTAQVEIQQPTEVMPSLVQSVGLTCTINAELILTATEGTAPYFYFNESTNLWESFNNGSSHTFTNIVDGTYQFRVRDDNDCEAPISNQVTVDPVSPLLIDIDDNAAFINCTGEASATIIANASGGLGNYSYELYSDATLSNLTAGPQTNSTFSSLAAGSYYVRVTSQDCEASSTEILIVDPAPLQIDREEFTNVTCSGFEDGAITVEVSGGTGEILYAITPNLNQFDTVNTFDALAPGVYDVVAQDRNGCFIPFQFTIIEPLPVVVSTVSVIDEICEGDADGSIEIEISGGTAPYSTAFNSNADADFVPNQTTFNNLSVGTYVIFVRDAQGCEDNIIVDIEPGVNLNATVTPVYECSGVTPTNYIDVVLENPSISSDVLYGIDTTDTSVMRLSPDFINIAPGTHYLSIAHANGCIYTVEFEIQDFEPLTLTLEQNNINEITAVAGGGLEDYTFYFDGQDNGSDNTYIINRTDTFNVRLVDQNGCEVVAQIAIEFIDIEIPDFFTPDGDGDRDAFAPENQEAFPNILTIIYDRYGRELYRMRLNDAPWTGVYQGHNLPSGDYWYLIRLNGENDDREFVGHFTLYR